MLFFFNIPEKGCIPGKDIPPLSIRMGSVGRPGPSFPGFGLTGGENRSLTVGLRPMYPRGVLSLADHNAKFVAMPGGSIVAGVRGVDECHGDGPSPNLLLLPHFVHLCPRRVGGFVPHRGVLLLA